MPQPVEWKDNQMCFACGSKNPAGLHLNFEPVGEDGLQSEYTPGQNYQGFQDIVHGGFLGLLLDEVMVNLPWRRKREVVVTAEMKVRLHRPARVGQPLVIRAFPDGEIRNRLVLLRGEIRDRQGLLIASGQAKCVRVSNGNENRTVAG